jgi:predicted dehydrogenase
MPVAVLGCGKRGRQILDELATLPAVEVIAIADVDSGRIKGGKRRAPQAKSYSGHLELLAAAKKDPSLGPNAWFVATPTHTHRAVLEALLPYGSPIFLEAPLAHTLEDARAIVKMVEESGVPVHVGFEQRTNPLFVRARAIIRSGGIRDMIGISAHWHDKTSWRASSPDPAREKARNWKLNPLLAAGLSGEVCSHDFDIMCWLTRKRPTRVMASGATRLHRDGRSTPDTVQLSFNWKNGIRFDHEATLANSFGGNYIDIFGTHGTVRLSDGQAWLFKEDDAATLGWEVYATREQVQNDNGIILRADATKLAKQGKLNESSKMQDSLLRYALKGFLGMVVDAGANPCTVVDAYPATAMGILGSQAIQGDGVLALEADNFAASL